MNPTIDNLCNYLGRTRQWWWYRRTNHQNEADLMWRGFVAYCESLGFDYMSMKHQAKIADKKPHDKELVWCWNDDETHFRSLHFYDEKNKTAYAHTGERNGTEFQNCAPYEGEWPEWAKESRKTLKD